MIVIARYATNSLRSLDRTHIVLNTLYNFLRKWTFLFFNRINNCVNHISICIEIDNKTIVNPCLSAISTVLFPYILKRSKTSNPDTCQ